MGTLIRHEQCPKCKEAGRDNSEDNLGVYDDGSSYCYSCEYTNGSSQSNVSSTLLSKPQYDSPFRRGIFTAIPARHISEKTCKFWGYQTDPASGDQIATNYDEKKKPLGQKIRTKDKRFTIKGTYDGLYGKWLWNSGRFLVITEGELDALSYSEATKCRYPVVSVSKGAANAYNDIKKDLKWIEDNFESVILFLDNDEAGIDATNKIAPLFSPGKCKIVKTSEKDASDLLVKGKISDLINCVFKAKEYRPESIISSTDEGIRDKVCDFSVVCDLKYPYGGLNKKTHGLRKGELVTICSGSGQGKSQFCKELAFHILKSNKPLGYISLEEDWTDVYRGIMSLESNTILKMNPDKYTTKEMADLYDKVIGSKKFYVYDEWAGNIERILSDMRYLIKGCDVEWIILDHISILVSGLGEANERIIIDQLMTKLRLLVAETGVGMIIVSHLKRPGGEQGHEDGAITSVAQLRGSAAIAQLSDIVIGLERDQQGEDKTGKKHRDPNEVTVRVLKNRYSGDTGVAGMLYYNKDTGRLLENHKIMFNNEEDKVKAITDSY